MAERNVTERALTERAVTELKSPLNSDAVLLTLLALIMSAGFIAMSSASLEYALERSGNAFYFTQRYGFHLALALLLAITAYQVPVQQWQRMSGVLLLFGFLLLALVIVPGIGREVNGSRRWLVAGPLTLQVSEFAKFFVVLYLAGYLVRRRTEVQEQFSGFLKPILLIIAVTCLLMLEPDFGATVVTGGTAFVMLFLGGARLLQFLAVVAAGVAAAVAMVLVSPYRMKRLTAFADPWADQFNSGYQLTQSLIAFGQGQWTGTGLGNSVQKLFYLPEAHTDFVFAIWAEETGFIGALLALLLFAALIGRVLWIGRRAELRGFLFHGFVCYGVATLISAQVFINVGVTSGLLPTKGLTLPLWSYGGSSLLATLLMLAVVMRIHRELSEVTDERR